MTSYLKVEAEIFPSNCIYNKETEKAEWGFHYRGLAMMAPSSKLEIEVPVEELGNIPAFFGGSALISKITFIYY